MPLNCRFVVLTFRQTGTDNEIIGVLRCRAVNGDAFGNVTSTLASEW